MTNNKFKIIAYWLSGILMTAVGAMTTEPFVRMIVIVSLVLMTIGLIIEKKQLG